MRKKLAVKEKGGALAAVPEYLKGSKGRGMEKVEQKDIKFPRVTLLQSGSPSVKAKKMEAGMIVDSISGKPFVGDGSSIEFIAITHFKSRIMFDGVGKEATIACSSADNKKASNGDVCAKCPSSQWVESKGKSTPPACTELYNFPILVLGKDKPIVSGLSLGHTKIKAAQKLLTLVVHTGMDMFALKFKLTTILATSPSGDYYNFDVEGAGYPTEEEYNLAVQFYESTKGKDIAIAAEGEEPAEDKPNGKTGKNKI